LRLRLRTPITALLLFHHFSQTTEFCFEEKKLC
jgi:hypothetical protein